MSRLGMLGVPGVACGSAPSTLSVNVAVSPTVMLSRCKVAVNVAATRLEGAKPAVEKGRAMIRVRPQWRSADFQSLPRLTWQGLEICATKAKRTPPRSGGSLRLRLLIRIGNDNLRMNAPSK